MDFYRPDFPVRRIFESSLLLIICCAFYLAWWLLAFKPTGAVKGMKTGWLLIPAFAAGLAAIFLAIGGIQAVPAGAAVSPGLIFWGGIAAYLILLAITRLLLKRPVTTELFLIVGWAMLALSEINALYGTGRFSQRPATFFAAAIGAAALASLVCYVLYYDLGSRAGYFDGMIPLLLVGLVTAGITVAIGAA